MSRPAIDMTGKRVGRLTVLERAGTNSGGNVTWLSRCDCGNRTRSSGTDLRRGRTVSCGCHAHDMTKARHAETRKQVIEQQFGRLTVTEFAGINDQHRSTYRCTCECGGETIADGHHLKDGNIVSCGCRAADPRPGARSEDPGYVGAHYRVKFEHGSASDHPCVDCAGQAEDWSYDHTDPNEKYDDRGRPYSPDPTHYQPRCRRCHRQFDLNNKETA